jgi:uncharacterized protein (TIGR03437 family)
LSRHFCFLIGFSLLLSASVRAQSLSFQLDQSDLTFTAVQDSVAPDPQTVGIQSSAATLTFTATSSAPWLLVAPKTGVIPGQVQISVDPTALTAGNYTGTVTITSAQASPVSRQLRVSLAVAPAVPAKMTLSTDTISFSVVQGAAPVSSSFSVINSGSGRLSYSAALSGGTPWLSISPAAGAATSADAGTVTVTATPGTLLAGTLTASIQVTSATTGETKSISVSLAISAAKKKLLLSQTGLTFVGSSGGGRPLPQTFGILNLGQQNLDWRLRVIIAGDGPSSWLSVSPLSGTVVRPYLDVSTVTVQVNPGVLAAGDYYAQIQVISDGADNSPQTVTVLFTVRPPGIPLPPEVRPSGLIFTALPGTSTPSQDFRISIPGTEPLTFNSSRLTLDGQTWFTHNPQRGTVLPDQPLPVTVQPNLGTLLSAIYNGVITMQFSDSHVSTVKLLSVVAPSGTASAKPGTRSAATCSVNALHVQFTNVPADAVATLGQPLPLEVQVVDNCGTALTPDRGGVTVTARFSNGDTALTMVHTGSGKWSRTWQPLNFTTPVRIAVTAYLSQGIALTGGQSQTAVAMRPTSNTPRVQQGAVLNAASYVPNAPLAPGALITLKGASLADTTASKDGAMLPTSLGNTEVRLGDRPLPLLYASDGQINAQLPDDVPFNTELQLVVRRASAISVPLLVTVAEAQPAVFTADQSGQGQAAMIDTVTGAQNSADAPAHAGDSIQIFCTGLGAVNPAVPAGTPAIDPAPTVNPVTVLIGGVPADVQYAGLSPDTPGLYYINATVPDGVAPGDAVPMTVTVAAQTSPIVTMVMR